MSVWIRSGRRKSNEWEDDDDGNEEYNFDLIPAWTPGSPPLDDHPHFNVLMRWQLAIGREGFQGEKDKQGDMLSLSKKGNECGEYKCIPFDKSFN